MKILSREFPWTPNLGGGKPAQSPNCARAGAKHRFFPLQTSFDGTHLLPSHPWARLRADALRTQFCFLQISCFANNFYEFKAFSHL